MTRLEKTLLAATAILVACGLVTWGILSATGGGRPTANSSPPPQVPGTAPGGIADGQGTPGGSPSGMSSDPTLASPVPTGRGIPNSLRAPSGEDLSNPERVKELLRQHLAVENPRWDWIADLLGVYQGQLPDDVRWALKNALARGNAAGAIQAYERVRDPTVVPDLLTLLDDPELDARGRANVLIAVSTMPGGDAATVVTGIESRLDGDFEHDRPYWEAIARKGSAEAVRAFLAGIAAAKDPSVFERMLFRELDVRKDAVSSELIAAALADKNASPGALRAYADLAGRPGVSPAVVDALAALDADGTDRLVRIQAEASLARTGDERAVLHLLDVAGKGADYASVAARAIADIDTSTVAARAALLDTAQKTADENLKTQIVIALGNLKEPKAVPFLTDTLAKGGALVRWEAAKSLGRIGSAAGPAVETFRDAWPSADEGARCVVAIALGQIGTPEARRLLDQVEASETSARVKRTIQITKNALASRAPP